MFRTLYARLAAALLALFVVLGVLQLVLTLYSTRRYLMEVDQRLHQALAGKVLQERSLLRDGEADEEALAQVFQRLMTVNPSIEVYLLDPAGGVLAHAAPPGRVQRERVSLGPIRAFLAGAAPLPILGDDPRDVRGRKIFSAAPIPTADGAQGAPLQGYLYIVLGGQEYESVAQRVRGSYILRLSLWAAALGLALLLLAGLGLFRVLTRRLGLLAATLDRFRDARLAGSVSVPVGVRRGSGDEIDRLADSYEQMAQRIQEQLRELEQTDRLRRELVANVSHDLRTPLAALQGYLETLLLKRETLPAEEQQRYLEIAAKHSERLGRLVGQLFELAKLDSGAVRLRPERFSLAELAQDVVHGLQPEAEAKGVRLEAHREREVPPVEADIELVERVFSNLIENAIRHTPFGGTVRVSVAAEPDDVLAEVSDTGCGIPQEELERVFDRFYRSPRTPESSQGGAGLGLAIVRRIVELHRGRVEARSQLNVGTTLAFRLPLGEATSTVSRDENVKVA